MFCIDSLDLLWNGVLVAFVTDSKPYMVLCRIFESDLYLTSVLYSSSYATYIRRF